MAKIKISQLTAKGANLANTDLLPIAEVSGAAYVTKRVNGNNVNNKLFSQTSNGTLITNTIAQTSLLGTGVGSLTIPANNFVVGDSFHLNIKGDLSSLNNADLTIDIKSNGVTLATSGVIVLPLIINDFFELEIDFVIRSIGAATVGSIFTAGEFNFMQHSGNNFQGNMFHFLNNTTFDTTISNTLNIYATWGAASTSNKIQSNFTNLRRTY